MRPAGMPVQPSTISAIACAVDHGKDQRLFALQLAQPRRELARSLPLGVRGVPAAASAPVARASWLPAASMLPRTRVDLASRGSFSRSQRSSSAASSSLRSLLARPLELVAPRSCDRRPMRRLALEDRELGVDQRRCAAGGPRSAAGIAVWLIATRAQAVSSRLTALSGSWRPGCSAPTAAPPRSTASSRMRTL